MAEDTYGKIARHGTVAPRVRPQEPPPVAVRSLTLADPRVEMPTLQRDYLVPSFTTAKRGESEALEVLAHILGSGSNSRLYQRTGRRQADRGHGRRLVRQRTRSICRNSASYGAPRPGVSLPQLETEIDDGDRASRDKGVTPEELERTKTRLIADAVYAQDNQATMARWYGAALTTGATVNDVRSWTDRIRAVTAEAGAEAAARQWLEKQRSVTGYLIKDKSPQVEKRS